jgi:hypothetical protein
MVQKEAIKRKKPKPEGFKMEIRKHFLMVKFTQF